MSKHPFIAVALETTGLDPARDQILQIGAVAYGGDGEPVEFYELVRHDRYYGDPYALDMNAELIRLADGEGVRLGDALAYLSEFLETHCATQPFAVGFNVGPFDLRFVEEVWREMSSRQVRYRWPFHHRTIELGSLLASPDGMPCTSAKAVALLLGKEVAHDALEDARDAAELHRTWIEKGSPWVGGGW